MGEINRRLAALGRTEIDHDLDGLESAVWARVDGRKPGSFLPLPNRLAAATCAGMAMLASFAGASTALAMDRAQAETGAFAIRAPLAPSTALGD